MNLGAETIRSKLVTKAVRNVRRGYQDDESNRGMYREGIKLDLTRSRLLTESYKETDGQPMVMRRAKALENILSKMPLYIQDWERIVGSNVAFPEGLFYGIEVNWRSMKRMVSSKEAQSLLDDAGREELDQLIDYWKGKTMSDRQQEMFTGDILKYWKYDGTFMWSHWSELGIPNYEKIFKIGLKGLIQEADTRLAEIDRQIPSDYIEQKEFLQAVILSLRAVIRFAHRYSALAKEMAADTNDPNGKKRLEEIAETCAWVPENPPRTLLEALQSFFFIHVVRYIEFFTLGIGVRFDKVFGPYLENDLKQGRLDRKEALELLQLLWVKFQELGFVMSPLLSGIYGGVESLQTLTIGGLDEQGRDLTNEMTYLILETAKTMRTLEPSLALRYHDDTPEELLLAATEVIKTGLGYPAFFNDKSILPLLEKWNVPRMDALDYAIASCVYLEIPGKNITRRFYGGMCLLKCLWWALNQGIAPKTGMQWGAPTPDPRTFKSADDLMEAYLEQVRFFFKRQNAIENTARELYARYIPRPFYSAVLDGCIEKGKDCKQWAYPSPVHDICVIVGPTNVADSITAVKKNVFDDKKLTMDELLKALAADWQGYESVRQLMLSAPKYGNDDDYADDIARMVHHKTAEVMAEFTDRFGNFCRGDGSGLSATYAVGFDTPATPDGRRDGETYADATLSPIQGLDRKGPTAVLKSAAKIDTTKTYNHLLNQKFQPDMLNGDMKKVFISYLRSWGQLGISHIQFNVVDRETLLAAQKNPEEYRALIVRVAGYSAYFTDLSKGLQDSIISRTEQSF